MNSIAPYSFFSLNQPEEEDAERPVVIVLPPTPPSGAPFVLLPSAAEQQLNSFHHFLPQHPPLPFVHHPSPHFSATSSTRNLPPAVAAGVGAAAAAAPSTRNPVGGCAAAVAAAPSIRKLPPAVAAGGGAAAAVTNSTSASSAHIYDQRISFSSQDLLLLSELRDRIRGYVDDLIRSHFVVSTEEAAAYLQAMEYDAELVKSETDPIQFVRYTQYDLWAGAKRLCVYWTERLKLFGPERAFLPLVITGTGALTEEDLLTLYAGWPAILPESPTRPKSLFMDRRKWIPDKDSSVENKLRCLFYVVRVLCEDDRAQVEGVCAFSSIMTPRFANWNLLLMHRGLYLAAQAFPIYLHTHLLNFVPRRQRKSILTNAVQFIIKTVKQFTPFPDKPIHVHVQRGEEKNNSKNQIFQDLLALGLTKKEIPLSFGGEWRYDQFFQWCQKRKEWEEEIYKDRLLPRSAVGEQPNPPLARTIHPPAHEETGEVLANKKRRIADLVHSRRKRERRKKEELFIREEYAKMTQEQRDLQTEHARLQELFAQAQNVVTSLSSSDEEQDKQQQ
ncbi:hypothetical protein ACA910_002130 [Epithemia clementina (nom. ined.)]